MRISAPGRVQGRHEGGSKTGPFKGLARRGQLRGADFNQRSEQRSHLEALVKLREARVKGASVSDGKLTQLPNFEDRRYEFGKRGKAKWPPDIVAPNPPRDEMSSNFVNALLCSKSGCGHTFAEHRGGTGVSPIRRDWPRTASTAGSPWIGRPTDAGTPRLNSVRMTASRGVCKGSPCRSALACDPFRLPVPLSLSRLPG
jgi:hypothetical protein